MIGVPLRQKRAKSPKNVHFGIPSIADSAMKNLLRRRSMQVPALLLMALLLLFAANAGKLLVVDDPQVSDVIVVLAGETDTRPEHALQLLKQRLCSTDLAGRARRGQDLQLDEPRTGAKICAKSAAGRVDQHLPDCGTLHSRRISRRTKVPVKPAIGKSTDRHFRLSYSTFAKHLPARVLEQNFLCRSR